MELCHNDKDCEKRFSGEEDIELMKEKIKLVPLSDIDFDCPVEMDMDVDSSVQEHALNLNFEFSDQASPKQLEQRDLSLMDANNEGVDVKRVKSESLEMSETEPPPDFSLWTVEDDILLKNSMEAGAATEALAKGAVQFSQRFTVKELRERWRALLYDPIISEEAATRMLKSDSLIINMGKVSNLNKLKYPLVSNRKRKLKSVRFHYYNKKRCNALETHVKEELESCSESSFSQKIRLCPANEIREPVEATPSTEDTFQGNTHSLPNEDAAVLPISMPGEQGEMQMPSQGAVITSEKKLDVSTNDSVDSKQQLSPTKQVSDVHGNYHVSEFDGSQTIPPPVLLDKKNHKMMELCTDDKSKVSDKQLTIEISIPEQMICVLNTEDTEIPSPPSGSLPLFSSRYFPLELKNVKSESGLPGGAYPRVDDYELSAYGLRRSALESKRNLSPLVKRESILEGLECELKYHKKMQGSYPSAHINSIDLSAPMKDKDVLPESPGGHMLKNMLLVSQEKADDLSLIHTDDPGYLKELDLPIHEEMLNHLDEDICHTDQITEQKHDDGFESDPELPSFSDVEAMILDMDLDSAFDEDAQARAESRRLYRRQRKTLVRLEQGARASLDRTLTHNGAIAVLYGHHLRYYIERNEVLLGRVTLDNAVDIDLAKEGRANKVSRRQATIRLKEDGVFYLKNLGRRDLFVNNIPIPNGQHAMLGSNCLIEVGGMRFIFETNRRLVKQRVEEMLQNRLQV